MNGTDGVVVDRDFFAGAMPKEEIGALRFLKENPDYDGRGVTIAIFDTGVDPGTKGLQITTDGRPKIVDVLDCTGSGDVDTSEIVKLDTDGCVKGLNGKLMKVNPEWKNPSGEWHVGVRPVYELLPSSLAQYMKERRLKKFQESQREAVTHANKELADFQTAHPKCTEEEDQKKKTELESRVQLLQTMMTNHVDRGPIIDCVVWNDGEKWRAALDTSDLYGEREEKGKLADFSPLTNFHLEHGYGTLSEQDACNFVCNIYDDGNLLSIVIDAGMHGTHVAGIAAAYHPESPEFNGIAPGARILICKIGDTRVGTMETGVGLVRAAIAAIHWDVDLINLSYGECFAFPNSGRVMTTINDLVRKHGIMFVTAAGNNGPALSTVGAPACGAGTISIGAYVSPAMAAAAHSMREQLKEGRQYTFSSRGPTINGTLGVDLSAPGGAISNVPQWCGRSRMLANGTSMASPCTSGGVALLLSGLKQTGDVLTNSRVRRALENTAILPSDSDYQAPAELIFGRGLVQVDAAWSYLEKSSEVDKEDIHFEVSARRSDNSFQRTASNASSDIPQYSSTSGIYIREPWDLGGVHSYICSVTPVLPEEADIVSEKLDVEIKLALECNQKWVKCPDALLLPHRGRTFEVEVDATSLSNEVNYAEVQGYDSEAKWRGPLFRIPITVLSPKKIDENVVDIQLGAFDFEAGKEQRRFTVIPTGATWASVNFTMGDFNGNRVFFFEARSLLPDMRTDELSTDARLELSTGKRNGVVFPVVEGRLLEICLAQYWSSLGKCSVSIELEFHGVTLLQGQQLTLDGAACNLKLQVSAPLRKEQLAPSFSLNSVCIPLRPSDSSLVPLNGVRDTLPDSCVIHKLTLTYKLKLQEGGKITPRLPMFNRQAYDCEVEGQMVQVFDVNKKLMVVSDIYPNSVTVKKGDYTIIAVIRHDNTTVLKHFENLPLIVEKQLDKAITIPVYKTHLDSTSGGKAFTTSDLYRGQMVTLVLGPLTDALPKDCTPGLVMHGKVTMSQSTNRTPAPSRATFSYIVPPNKNSTDSNDAPLEELPTPAKISNAARDAMIKTLEGLNVSTDSDLKEFDVAVVKLKTDYPGHLPLLTAVLKKYDGLEEAKRAAKVDDILSLCEEIISCIDKIELACFLARKCPDETKEGKKRSKEATEEKEALILALEKQLTTTMKLQEAKGTVDYEALKPSFEELKKWADPNEAPLAFMHAKFEASCGRHAEAIKLLDVLINSDKSLASREVYELKVEYTLALGWRHWARYQKTQIEIDFPKKLALF